MMSTATVDYLASLSEDRLASFHNALVPRLTKYIPHLPFMKQRYFLNLDCEEALYGGAAGGGKSDALLMGALQYVDVPGYHAIIFRRTFADLERAGALIPRSHEWLEPTDAHWNGRYWTFPSGATLEFGYLDNDADVWRYQGGDWAYIAFDELTQLKEEWYRYLFSRKRRLKVMDDVPTRVRAATNPGGIGHEWVKQRFLVEGPLVGREFVPARLEDNPYLDQADYDRSLQALDPTTQRQLRWGDWSVKPLGSFFQRQWFARIDQLPPASRPIRMWDLAATKQQTSAYTAGGKIAWYAGELLIAHIARLRGDPGEVEQLIRQTAEVDGRGTPIWIEQEPGSGGVNTLYRYQHYVLAGWNVRAYVPKHDKLTRAAPLSALARAGGVKIVAGAWNGPYLDEVGAFPDGLKDQVDVTSAAYQVLTQTPEVRIRRL